MHEFTLHNHDVTLNNGNGKCAVMHREDLVLGHWLYAIQRTTRTRKSNNSVHGVQENTAVQVEIRDIGVTSW